MENSKNQLRMSILLMFAILLAGIKAAGEDSEGPNKEPESEYEICKHPALDTLDPELQERILALTEGLKGEDVLAIKALEGFYPIRYTDCFVEIPKRLQVRDISTVREFIERNFLNQVENGVAFSVPLDRVTWLGGNQIKFSRVVGSTIFDIGIQLKDEACRRRMDCFSISLPPGFMTSESNMERKKVIHSLEVIRESGRNLEEWEDSMQKLYVYLVHEKRNFCVEVRMLTTNDILFLLRRGDNDSVRVVSPDSWSTFWDFWTSIPYNDK